MKNYHSRSYHRFFEGYTEKGIVNEKGNYQIVRVYTGDYYEPVSYTHLRAIRRHSEMSISK